MGLKVFNRPSSGTISVYLAIILALQFGCKTSKQVATNQNSALVADTLSSDTLSITIDQQAIAEELNDTIETAPLPIYKDVIKVIGVGDIMMSTNFPSEDYLAPNNAIDYWSEVQSTLVRGDVTFGNLEGVILDDGGEQKECRNPKVCYLFRTPVRYSSNLQDSGFDLMSLANNHAGDFGDTGRRSTMNVLDSLGIGYAGLLEAPYTTISVEGLTVGFAAFAPNKGTMSIHDKTKIAEVLSHLDSVSDIVITSFHAGAEGPEHLHITRETETYYGENRGNVYELGRYLIDHGADLVLGHGPHVPRAIDLYKQRFIAYSLGNFFTFGRFSLKAEKGMSYILEVDIDREGKFLQGKINSVKLVGRGYPIFDDSSAGLKLIQRITKEDFPELPLMIDDTGTINYIDN